MEIIVGRTAGFCYGVKNAVEKSIEELEKNEEICCLGEIVHNSKVVNKLEQMGVEFIESLGENHKNKKTIIRAHGISKKVYCEAQQKGIELVDLTCPNVLKIHKIAAEHEAQGDYIFVIGNRTHPETIGTVSFCGKYFDIIEHESDIMDAVLNFNKSDKQNLLIIVQTTFSVEKFDKYVEQIRRNVLKDKQIKVYNSICNATKVRQEETEEISRNVECMIIIGGKNSSNTRKLYEIASKNCTNVECVEDLMEIDIDSYKNVKSVGIMAGASTPQDSIKEIYEALKDCSKEKCTI